MQTAKTGHVESIKAYSQTPENKVLILEQCNYPNIGIYFFAWVEMPWVEMPWVEMPIGSTEYTVAIWRIKAADTSIEVRLAKRLGHPNGFCSVEYFEKSNQLYQHYAPQLEELKKLTEEQINQTLREASQKTKSEIWESIKS